jgi:hypothetical protein
MEESKHIYELIGTICGMAVANGTILNVKFPRFLYARLIKKVSKSSNLNQTLDLLAEIDGDLAKQLAKLLDLSADEIASLDMDFSVNRNLFGAKTTIELIPGGKETAVTNENLIRYILAYANFILFDEFEDHFQGWKRGWEKITHKNDILCKLSGQELQLLVEGDKTHDIRLLDLKKGCRYVGFQKDDPTVDFFWSVLSSLDRDHAKAFLVFLTGSSGVPISGLKGFQITIQKSGTDTARLPVAHTCAATLDLPAGYANQQQLESKLLMALSEGGGFGLI